MQLKNSTGLLIAGIGAAVTGLGTLIGGRAGSMVKGFGIAHIALGMLNHFKPRIRKQ